MRSDPDWWSSFTILWGPWILLVAFGALGALTLAWLVRRVLRSLGAQVAAAWLVASVLSGMLAFATVIGLALVLGRENVSFGAVVALGTLLLVALLGLLGCGGYAVWRLVETRPVR